eukprot:scaffold2557_cov121-Cylindrotheca_fusiformis.AAC.27
MEKYRLVKGDVTNDSFLEATTGCEVRITQQGKPRNYISYAMGLLSEGSDTVILKAMGRAINKAVTIAEILKRKMPLHQLNSLSSVEMVDVFEPLEEGLDTVTSRRYVSCMKITLSLTLGDMKTTDIGYQPPLPIEEMHPGDFHPLREAALIASS